MPVSGETPTPPAAPQPAPPAAPSVPAGYTQVSEAEQNRINAELRVLRKEKADREAAEAEAERVAAEARGQYDQALAAEKARAAAAEARATELAVDGALRNAVMAEGLAGDQAAALLALVPKSQVTVTDGVADPAAASAAVKAARAAYPSLFAAPAPATETPAPAAPPTVPGATPPATPPAPPGGGAEMTMEEYLSAPQKVRLSKDFQERFEKARERNPKLFPDSVPASSFSQDT